MFRCTVVSRDSELFELTVFEIARFDFMYNFLWLGSDHVFIKFGAGKKKIIWLANSLTSFWPEGPGSIHG